LTLTTYPEAKSLLEAILGGGWGSRRAAKVSETWWVVVAYRWGGEAFCRHHPRCVVSGDTRATIVDFLGLTRIVGLEGLTSLRRTAKVGEVMLVI
jgi:ribosomal protein S14